MSIVRNSVTAFVPQIVGIVFGIGTSIVTARALGPAGRGVLSLALLAVTVLLLLSDAGMYPSLTYHVSKKRISASEALGISAYATLLLAGIAIVAAVLLWPVLEDNVLAGVQLEQYYAAVAALPAMLLANMWTRVQMALDRFVLAISYQIAITVGTFLAALGVFLVAGGDLLAYLRTLAVLYWAVSLTLFVSSAFRQGFTARLPLSKIRGIASFAARAYGGSVVNYALFRVDTFVLNAFQGNTQVGFYTMAATLAEKAWIVDTATINAAAPRVAAAEREDAGPLVAAVTRNIILMVGLVVGALALVAPWVIELLYGAEFLPAAGALRLLAPGVVGFAASRSLFQYHSVHLGRPGTVSAVRGVMAAIGIAGYLYAIPRWSMTGAAVTTSMIYLASFLVALVMFTTKSQTSPIDVLVPKAEDFRRYTRTLRTFARRLRLVRSPDAAASSDAATAATTPASPAGPTHVIVLCGGPGERWGNHLGVRKHLITIEGEVLLDRTLRLIDEYAAPDTHVFVVATDMEYARPGTRLVAPQSDPFWGDADKFMSSKALWNTEGRTVVMFGDVWYSETAMRTILSHTEERWAVFGRERESMVTHKPWPEMFAQSFYPRDLPMHERALEQIAEGYRAKDYEGQAGWRQYRVIIGARPGGPFVVNGRLVDIDDFTDDFDLPVDHERWQARRAELRGPFAVPTGARGDGPEVTVELTAEAVDLIAAESSAGVVRNDPVTVRDRHVARLRLDSARGSVLLGVRDGAIVVLPFRG